MKNAIIDFVDALAGLTNAEDRWRVAVEQTKKMGIDAILVGEANGIEKQIFWMNTTMPDDWIAEYLEENYLAVDPMMDELAWRKKSVEINTGLLKRDDAPTEKNYVMDHSMKSYGLSALLGSRFGAEGKRATFVTLCSSDTMRAMTQNSEVELTMLSALLATTITDPIQSKANVKLQAIAQPLSQRQQEVLELLGSGFQTARIAERLKISEAAVNKHFFQARKSLGAATREQALAIALKQRLIDL